MTTYTITDTITGDITTINSFDNNDTIAATLNELFPEAEGEIAEALTTLTEAISGGNDIEYGLEEFLALSITRD